MSKLCKILNKKNYKIVYDQITYQINKIKTQKSQVKLRKNKNKCDKEHQNFVNGLTFLSILLFS